MTRTTHLNFCRVLSAAPVALGFLCVGVPLLLGQRFPAHLEDWAISGAFFFWGLSGLPVMLCRGARSRLALLEGAALLLVCWGVAFGLPLLRVMAGGGD